MKPTTLRGGLVAATLGITLALTGCGGSPVSFGSGSSAPAGAGATSDDSSGASNPDTTDDAGSADAGAGQDSSDGQDGAAPRFPEFPVLSFDVMSLVLG